MAMKVLLLLLFPAMLVALGAYGLYEMQDEPKGRSAYRIHPMSGDVFASCWMTYDETEAGRDKIRRLACR